MLISLTLLSAFSATGGEGALVLSWSFDEPNGTTILDASGSALHGTLTGPAVQRTAANGSAGTGAVTQTENDPTNPAVHGDAGITFTVASALQLTRFQIDFAFRPGGSVGRSAIFGTGAYTLQVWDNRLVFSQPGVADVQSPTLSLSNTALNQLGVRYDQPTQTVTFLKDGATVGTATANLGSYAASGKCMFTAGVGFVRSGTLGDLKIYDLSRAPILERHVFLGGAGDQVGTSIAVSGSSVYVAGPTVAAQNVNDETLIAGFAIPPAALPQWTKNWRQGVLNGLTATNEGLYGTGHSYLLTTDGVGGKEVKTIVAKFRLDGTNGPGPGGSELVGTANFFSYTGVEYGNGALAVTEGPSMFIYTAGAGQPCSYSGYIVAKFNTSASRVAAATDSSVGLAFANCSTPSTGGSNANTVVALNGALFFGGATGWTFEDPYSRPVIWKYNSSLGLVTRTRDTSLAGIFNGGAALGGSVYMVGQVYTIGSPGQENFVAQKFDEAGNRVWSQTWGDSGTDNLTGAVALNGRLFAVGFTQSQGAGGTDGILYELDPATGNRLASVLFGGASDDRFNGIATDGTDLYVVGESRSFTANGNGSGQNDLVLIRYLLGSSPPTVTTAANATPNPVSGNSTSLSVRGSDDAGEAALTYTWVAAGTPPAPVAFGPNGTNASKDITAFFSRAGTYDLQVTITDGSGQTATSLVAVTVNATLSSIQVSPNPVSVATNASQPFSAVALDQFGQAMASQPTFNWSVNGGGGINTSGVFIAGSSTGGPFTVSATASSITGSASVTVTSSSGPPSKLGVLVQPSNSLAGNAIAPAIKVAIQDSNGTTVTTSSASVTLALGNNPSGATLGGTTTIAAINGVATFGDLSLNRVGSGYTLVCSSTALTSATTSTFDVAPNVPAVLAFTGQPGNSTIGALIAPAVQVAVRDNSGNVVTSATNLVSLTIGINPGGGALSGTATVAAVNGVATFSNLQISQPGAGYTLVANAATLTATTSNPFTIGDPTVTVTASDPLAIESGDTATFTVTLGNPLETDLSIFYTISGSATPSVDYAAIASSVLIPAGNASATVTITPILDTVGESGETVVLTLAAGAGYVIGSPAAATASVFDAHGLAITGSGLRTRENGQTATFTVALTVPPQGDVFIDIESKTTGEGTVNPSSLFFTPTNFSTPQTVTVIGADDTLADGPKSFFVEVKVFSSDVNYKSLPLYVLTVVNDDDELPTFASNLSATATVGLPFNYPLAASNGPSTYSATGLPNGLSLNPATGVITGLPSAPGIFAVTLSATNLAGTTSATLNLSVILKATITSLSPRGATKSSPGFPLTVNGVNFQPGAKVSWNGAELATLFVDATQLTAVVPIGNLAQSGQVAIRVVNPGDGLSEPAGFGVYNGPVGTYVVDKKSDADATGEVTFGFALKNVLPGDTITFSSTKFTAANAEIANAIAVGATDEEFRLTVDGVTIDAQNQKVPIVGPNSKTGLLITSANNRVQGLTFRNFSVGVKIQGAGARNNVLGGRRDAGASAQSNERGNGMGLRLSGNPGAGLEITQGAAANTIKGCWIGIDIGGGGKDPNDVGILINLGSKNNIIGSSVTGEANVIAANKNAAIVVTDSGSTGNQFIGNIIGAGINFSNGARASARAIDLDSLVPLPNVNNGVVFASATAGNKLGGDGDGEGNLVAYNGNPQFGGSGTGSGIVVQEAARANSIRRNRIFKNGSGITLSNGNDDISSPGIEQVIHRGSPFNGRVRAKISGASSAVDGAIVEVFNDTGTQGQTPLGDATVNGGRWELEADIDPFQSITATVTGDAGTSGFSLFDGTQIKTLAILSGPQAVPNPAVAGQAVQFSAAVDPSNGKPLDPQWDFADGNTGAGLNPAHVFAAAGTYDARFSVSDGLANSEAAVSVRIDASDDDSDGDGISNADEIQAGTSPFDGTSTFQKLALTSMTIKMNVAKSGTDTASLVGTISGLPAGFTPDGLLELDMGGVPFSFQLNNKGAGTSANSSVTLRRKKGKTFENGGVFNFKLNKGAWSSSFADEGLDTSVSRKGDFRMRVTLRLKGLVYSQIVAGQMVTKVKKSATFSAKAQ